MNDFRYILKSHVRIQKFQREDQELFKKQRNVEYLNFKINILKQSYAVSLKWYMNIQRFMHEKFEYFDSLFHGAIDLKKNNYLILFEWYKK